MKIIILGLREKTTGDYYIFDPDLKRKKHTKVNFGEKVKIETLAPYPFSYYSSISFLYADNEDEFEKCYLEVESNLSKSEFNGMDSSGIVYYQFDNREVTPLREYKNPLQYALETKKRVKGKYQDWEIVTSLVNHPTIDEDESKAMTELLTIASRSYVKKKGRSNYSMDIKLDRNSIQYLPHLLELTKKGVAVKINTTRDYGENWKTVNFSDSFILEILDVWPDLTSDLVYAYPKFNYEFYREHIRGTKRMKPLFNSVYNKELFVNDHWEIDELFRDFFPMLEERLTEQLNYFTDEEKSYVEIFADKDFKVRIEHHSPYDYYCCPDCDGYDLCSVYTEEELEGEDTEIDDRINELAQLISEWDPFITEKSKDLFDFIPEELVIKLKDYDLDNLYSILKLDRTLS